MAKFASDTVYEGALAVADNATTWHICDGQPANHAGIAALSLAQVSVSAGAGNGDYTLANGDVSGRKLTCAAQTGVEVLVTGEADHIAGTDGTTLLWVTTCTPQTLTDGNTVDIPAFDIEFTDIA